MPEESRPAADATTLPCPFCGASPRVHSVLGYWKPGGYGPPGLRVSCTAPAEICTASAPPAFGPDAEAQAVRNWNRRA